MERTTTDMDARTELRDDTRTEMADDTQTEMRDDTRTTQEPRLATADLAEAGTASQPGAHTEDDAQSDGPLLDESRSGELRSRWETVQASFVDEPRQAVEQADSLVAEVLQDLARSFKTQRESLEKEWQLGDDVSTEELRQALRHYRSFFDRLLSL